MDHTRSYVWNIPIYILYGWDYHGLYGLYIYMDYIPRFMWDESDAHPSDHTTITSRLLGFPWMNKP
jgi:hypothetical protein